MKMITLHQPWASLVAVGAKRFETRSWLTNYRGPLVIHSAKRFTKEQKWYCHTEPFKTCLREADVIRLHELPLGTALCLVDLVEIFPTEKIINKLTEQEKQFGDYQPGRFAWKLESPRVFSKPIPMLGTRRIRALKTKELDLIYFRRFYLCMDL